MNDETRRQERATKNLSDSNGFLFLHGRSIRLKRRSPSINMSASSLPLSFSRLFFLLSFFPLYLEIHILRTILFFYCLHIDSIFIVLYLSNSMLVYTYILHMWYSYARESVRPFVRPCVWLNIGCADKMTLRIYRYMLISFIITFVYSNHSICLAFNFQPRTAYTYFLIIFQHAQWTFIYIETYYLYSMCFSSKKKKLVKLEAYH